MSSVHLFGLDAEAFAQRIQSEKTQILEATRARVESEGRLSPEEIELGMELAGKLCDGDLPADCTEDWFWVLCWIADTHWERIPLEALFSIKRFSYVEEIGIWPLFGRWQPPFSIPRAETSPPAVGFVPAKQINTDVLPELEAMPTTDVYAVQAREQLMEILESLEEDGLDLLAIFI